MVSAYIASCALERHEILPLVPSRRLTTYSMSIPPPPHELTLYPMHVNNVLPDKLKLHFRPLNSGFLSRFRRLTPP
jgi:hypothetical protein